MVLGSRRGKSRLERCFLLEGLKGKVWCGRRCGSIAHPFCSHRAGYNWERKHAFWSQTRLDAYARYLL